MAPEEVATALKAMFGANILPALLSAIQQNLR
jgi:hypothetical protein